MESEMVHHYLEEEKENETNNRVTFNASIEPQDEEPQAPSIERQKSFAGLEREDAVKLPEHRDGDTLVDLLPSVIMGFGLAYLAGMLTGSLLYSNWLIE